MLSVLCHARFGVQFCTWFSSANAYLKLLDRVVCGARFLTVGELNGIAHRRSVAVLCVLYKIVCQLVRVTRGALVAHRYTYMRLLAAEPRSTAGLLFSSRCLCRAILLTLYSMVLDWRVLRGPMVFIGLTCSVLFCLLLFFLSLLFFKGLVLLG